MICVISDTHENLPAIEHAVEKMNTLKPTLVIHCGDIISPPVLSAFKGLPMRFVYGNNDGEREGLRKACESNGFPVIDDTLDFEYEGKRIWVYHGTEPARLQKAIDSGKYDFVFTGHTHKMRDESVGSTRVVNPGALFMAPNYSFAAVDLGENEVEFIHVPKAGK